VVEFLSVMMKMFLWKTLRLRNLTVLFLDSTMLVLRLLILRNVQGL
jgi:hypothetical protein